MTLKSTLDKPNVVQAGLDFDGIKIFSATKAREREELGGRVGEWLAKHKGKIQLVDKVVTQSSDSEFHCYTITLFYKSLEESAQ